VSKVNEIKNLKREQKTITPTQALAESVGKENNVVLNEEIKVESIVNRKRVSFDLRTDLHKELKMQSIVQEKNIYILIEEALESYLKDIK